SGQRSSPRRSRVSPLVRNLGGLLERCERRSPVRVELPAQPLEPLDVDPVETPPTIHATLHEPRLPEDPQVLARSRLADPDAVGKLTDGQLPVQYQPQHRPAAGMRDGVDRFLHDDTLRSTHIRFFAYDNP